MTSRDLYELVSLMRNHSLMDASWMKARSFDDTPFMAGEFILHDSRLQFGSLNHDLVAGLNTERIVRGRPSSEAVNAAVGGLLLGQSGKHMLAARFTDFDLSATCRVQNFCISN